MKPSLVVGNLKMNLLSPRERDAYLRGLRSRFRRGLSAEVESVVCPPYVHLESFWRALEKLPVGLGVQDVFWERKGAYTGEISSVMAQSFGAKYALVGHSERRVYLGETDEIIARKVASAVEEGMEVILCVGEYPEDKARGTSQDRIYKQLVQGLEGFPQGKLDRLNVAYEPVWSIGTGRTPETREIAIMHEGIRKVIDRIFGSGAGAYVRVLYGGSVDVKNVGRVCLDADMDGVLLGGASLQPEEFMKIAQILGEQSA